MKYGQNEPDKHDFDAYPHAPLVDTRNQQLEHILQSCARQTESLNTTIITVLADMLIAAKHSNSSCESILDVHMHG